MKFSQYVKEATERLNPAIANSRKEQLTYSKLILIEEQGEIATELGSNIEELMAENIQKCNKRYNENGCRTNQMKMQEEARER